MTVRRKHQTSFYKSQKKNYKPAAVTLKIQMEIYSPKQEKTTGNETIPLEIWLAYIYNDTCTTLRVQNY